MSSPQIVHGPWLPTSMDSLELISRTMNMYSMLSDMMELGGLQQMRASDCAELSQYLSTLVAEESIHPSDVHITGLYDALRDITANGSKWPFAVKAKAKLLVKTWGIRFGSKFFGKSDGMAGLQDVLSSAKSISFKDVTAGSRSRKHFITSPSSDQPKAHRMLDLPHPVRNVRRQRPPWKPDMDIFTHPKMVVNPHHPGSLAFQAGDWWSGPAAAAKAGIIEWNVSHAMAELASLSEMVGHAHRVRLLESLPAPEAATDVGEDDLRSRAIRDGREKPEASYTVQCEAAAITYDDLGAYALVLSGEREQLPKKPLHMIFQAHPTDPGRKSLMRNLRTQDPVRVLRSCRQCGPWYDNKEAPGEKVRPQAGLRFDGLYRVVKYSVSSEPTNQRKWKYVYTLERLGGQVDLDKILSIPTKLMVRKALDAKQSSMGLNMAIKARSMRSGNEMESDDDMFWGIHSRALAAWQDEEDTRLDGGAYSRALVEYASAAVERIRSRTNSPAPPGF